MRSNSACVVIGCPRVVKERWETRAGDSPRARFIPVRAKFWRGARFTVAATNRPSSPEAVCCLEEEPLALRTIYEWTLQKAAAPAAEAWLATIAFIESSIFLVPADVLFVPMALAKSSRAYRYALTATIASTFGGIAGYYLGHYAYEEVAKPILAFYGKLDTFEQLRSSASRDAVLLMLVTSGLAHMPPIKVVTILSGAAGVNVWLFIASCIAARGARFFALAWALARYGEPIRDFIERRLGVVVGAATALVLVLYFAARYGF
jgi:membrane protein YqaA with SNARE-associated domain